MSSISQVLKSSSLILLMAFVTTSARTEKPIKSTEERSYRRRCACVSAATFSCAAAGYIPGTLTYEECVSDTQITCIETGACN